MEPVFRALEIAATSLVRVQGLDLRFSGLENIPRSGGAVLVLNHTGYVDFLPAAIGLYRADRRARYMIKSEVMDVAFIRFLVNHTKTVPVDRSKGAEAYGAAVDELRDGEIVCVYPEATISRSFELKAFKTGAARMAAEAGVPMIPTIIWGAHRLWTKGGHRNMGRSKLPVAVRYGTPIPVARDANPEAATADLREQMQQILHEVQDSYGEHPAGEFWVPSRMGGSAPTPADAAVIEDDEARRKAQARARKEAERSR